MATDYPDPTTLDDATLNQLSMQFQVEAQRRSILVGVPGQVASLAKAFVTSGGTPQTLIDTINTAATGGTQ